MLVSIVIPNYNYARYLALAIDSALGQTYPDIEVIVIDDGSTDDSAAIIRSYGTRITPILKANTGHCSCINLGFARSRGEVVIFLDADDLLLPDAVALHVAQFEDPAVVKSNGYLEVIDSLGRPTGARIPRRLSPSGDYRSLTLARGIDSCRSTHTSGNAWSRRFLQQVMPLPDSERIHNRVGPDGYLNSVDVLFGPIRAIDRTIGQYRVHGHNCGPVNASFDAAYLASRIECRRLRMAYAEDAARSLGLAVDPRGFHRFNEWRLDLMNEALARMEGRSAPTSFTELLSVPFRHRRDRMVRRSLLALLLGMTRVLPRGPALQLTNYLLTHRRRDLSPSRAA